MLPAQKLDADLESAEIAILQRRQGDKRNEPESAEVVEQHNHDVQLAHVKRCHACRFSIKR